LYLIERYLRARCLGATSDKAPKKIAVIVEFAQMMMPASDNGHMSAAESATLITLLKWASDPEFLKGNVTICIVAENLAELNATLVRNPTTSKIEITLPDPAERTQYLTTLYEMHHIGGELQTVENDYGTQSQVHEGGHIPVDVLSKLTAGLSRSSLTHIVKGALSESLPISSTYVQYMKKALIEKECYGMLEFMEPAFTLDMVSGCEGLAEEGRRTGESRQGGCTANGLFDMWPCRYWKDLYGAVLHWYYRHTVCKVIELPVTVARRY
jgi:hypothetical protein